MAVDSDGNVYVVDQYRVQKFDEDGTFLLQWGSEGPADGEFRNPLGIAIDDLDQIYVVDALNGNVQVFNTSGTFLRSFGSGSATPGGGEFFFATQAAVATDGSVYVTDQGNLSGFGNNVQEFDILGQFSSSFGTFGTSGDGVFQHPFGIDIDSSGDLYVADSGNHRIQKFDSVGGFLTTWGSEGSAAGQFLRPTNIAVDDDDRVYVTDLLNHRVQVFNKNGAIDFEFGSMGTADGEFSFPIDVATHDAQNIYVLDFGNSRIQRFALAQEIEIDLKPRKKRNFINPEARRYVRVALLTTSIAEGESTDFDAMEVDVSTVRMGGAAPKHANGHLRDVDWDGDLDLVVHFYIPDIGLQVGDTMVELSGMTHGGVCFLGEDRVITVHCW